jgi:tRNA 2-thiouridine synthesizing protein C
MYVDRKSLEDRGLTADDLVAVAWEDMESDETVDNIVEVIDSAQAAEVLAGADVVFSF